MNIKNVPDRNFNSNKCNYCRLLVQGSNEEEPKKLDKNMSD